MSRFPRLSETFVLNEILAVEEAGVTVEVFPLLRERTAVVQPQAVPLVARAHYQPFVSLAILASVVRALRRRPRTYLAAVAAVLRDTWGSANFFVGALGIIPKVTLMAEQMQTLGVTHVHCHFANHPAVAGFLVHRLTGIPFSFTAHGSDLHVDRHMLTRKVAEAAFVVAVSESNREVIGGECGPSSNVHVVYCGVDLDAFAVAATPADAPFTVACIGTLHEVKGQIHLLDALAVLRAEGLSLPCVLVGDGPDRAMLEQRAVAAGLDVVFTGKLTSPEIAAVLSRASVVAVPSVPTAEGKREGLPVVLMEALASGVPVVASNLSGIPEIIRHGRTGLLVGPGDVQGLAAALRRLHDEPELRDSLATAGRAVVAHRFDVRRNAGILAGMFTK